MARVMIRIRVSDPRWIASSAHHMIWWALEAIHQGSLTLILTLTLTLILTLIDSLDLGRRLGRSRLMFGGQKH